MNTQSLARYYDRLTPRERYPLIVAARARGDDVEAERLIHSAPTRLVRVADYRGTALGMEELAFFHLSQLLEAAALMWQTWGVSNSLRSGVLGEREDEAAALLTAARAYAYLFTVEMEAWERFCDELQIDPDALVCHLPGYEAVRRAARTAHALAFSPEEVTAAVDESSTETAARCTVESVLADFRKALATREQWA